MAQFGGIVKRCVAFLACKRQGSRVVNRMLMILRVDDTEGVESEMGVFISPAN